MLRPLDLLLLLLCGRRGTRARSRLAYRALVVLAGASRPPQRR
jgi:hypothetical protein